MNVRFLPAGDRAVLIELGDVSAGQLHAAARSLRAEPEVLACIAGQRSLYVVTRGMPDPAALRSRLMNTGDDPADGQVHRVRVSLAPRYALDLPEFLARHRLDREAFIERLASLRLTARYLGFRAGFAYLDGWPAAWAMPRRPGARARVPRGSFAIANEVAGFYPVDSPGGWNVLGRTDAPLWDPLRTPPNLIAAGDRVEIVPDDGEAEPADLPPPPPLRVDGADVVEGKLATIVEPRDWSRIESGLPPGGAFDEELAMLANLAAGNPPASPLFECALAGPRLRITRDGVIAWYGADSALPKGRAIPVRAGAEVDVGRIRNGLRGYLAVGPGGTAADVAIEREGDRLAIACGAGPHETAIREVRCVVAPRLDRVGIRLDPVEPLSMQAPADLPSCGMQFGTVQLHPDGSLVAMGPDHPVTGGYLQIMTVLRDERWKLGQLSPGEVVTLHTRSRSSP